MRHSPIKARRTGKSAVPDAPTSRHSSARKDLLLALSVGGSALLIVGLYVVSMRYQDAYNAPAEQDYPRWSALMDGIIEKAVPIQTQMDKLKSAVVAVADAKKTQSAATENLMKKLQARDAGSATETPETH